MWWYSRTQSSPQFNRTGKYIICDFISHHSDSRGYIVLWGNLGVKQMLNQERDVYSITSIKYLSLGFCKGWEKRVWASGPREFLNQKGPEILEEVAKGGGGCLIPGNMQGQVGLGLWASWSSWCSCSLQGGWTGWPVKVPSSPNYSMILWF